MPRHLISDAHEWINEIPTVPIYYFTYNMYEVSQKRMSDLRSKNVNFQN